MNKTKFYVVNLKRRADRFESFKNNYPLDISKVNRLEAVDGKTLKHIPNYFRKLLPGEVGCFLSHKLLWEKLVQDKESEYYVIFEDDAIYSNNFVEDFNAAFNNFVEFDTILYIGGRSTKNFKMKRCIKVKHNIVKYDYKQKWDPMDCDRGAYGYIIHKNCCKLLLKCFSQLIHNRKHTFPPVDHYILKVLRANRKEIYHTYPLICHAITNSDDSDIR